MNVASSEPDRDAPKALRFGVLVVASHNEFRKSQDRFTTMVGESPGLPRLSHICPSSLDGTSDGGGSWRAKPVPAQPFCSPPRLVQRDAHEVRLSEAEQSRLLLIGHLIKVCP